ncbi:cobalamin biosynthesis protein [Sphingobium sp. Sx8-8]|uniref:cobalamin biosynthesis protein n=1 Tax=Sphingobium sp. Sx8-8 TaxID=2933617 RepID=UPI001F584F41
MIVAGFGFREGATLASLEGALRAAAHDSLSVAALATLDSKADQLAPLARKLGLPLLQVARETLARQSVVTHSPMSEAIHGTGSVAEATALAAAGPAARLLSPRHVSPDRLATCALAASNFHERQPA